MASAVLLFAFGTGAMDAFAFLSLSGIFTANMTGNLILVGLVQRPGFPTQLVGASVAIVIFAATIYVTHRLLRRVQRPTVGARAVLIGLVGAQLIIAIGWALIHDDVSLPGQWCLIAVSAVAMALQTVAVRSITPGESVTSTYSTGAMTSLLEDLASGKARQTGVRAAAVLLLPAGALCAALLIQAAPPWGPAPSLLCALTATAIICASKARTLSGSRQGANDRA